MIRVSYIKQALRWADIYMVYWPSVGPRSLDIGQVLFLHVYGLKPQTHTEKEQDQNPVNLTAQAWSIKDLLYEKRLLLQDSTTLPAWIANHTIGFVLPCQLK